MHPDDTLLEGETPHIKSFAIFFEHADEVQKDYYSYKVCGSPWLVEKTKEFESYKSPLNLLLLSFA